MRKQVQGQEGRLTGVSIDIDDGREVVPERASRCSTAAATPLRTARRTMTIF